MLNNWITDENGNILWDQVNTIGLYVGAVLLVGALIAAAFLLDRKKAHKGFSTRSITFAAVCIAMSFALSYLKIVEMPQGGSITIASLLPSWCIPICLAPKKAYLRA